MPVHFEFITHGGFEAVTAAWDFVSHIMTANEYRTLVTSVFLLSIVLAALGGGLHWLTRPGPFNWKHAGLMGILMYAFFFQTGFGNWNLSGELAIYDPVKNLNRVITGLPPGIVALAGALNKAEVGMENLVYTLLAGPYTNYPTEDLLGNRFARKAMEGSLLATVMAAVPLQVHRSMERYIDDIAAPAFGHDPSLLEQFYRSHSDLLNVWDQTANPALYTVTWIDASCNPLTTAQTVDGQTAWNRLKQCFTAKTSWWQKVVDAYCEELGFDVSSAPSSSACRSIIGSFGQKYLGVNLTAERFIVNLYLGAMWKKWAARQDSTVMQAALVSSIKTQTALMSSGISSQVWLPHLKVVLTAVVIAVTPILMLFIASTEHWNAIKTLLGLYIWLASWGVMEAIVRGIWVREAMRVWDIVSSATGAGIGYVGQDMMWALSSKTLAILGGMEWIALMFAGVVTYGVLGFGGAALAHLARGMTAQVERGAAIEAGAAAMAPGRDLAQKYGHDYVDMAQVATWGSAPWKELYSIGKGSLHKAQADAGVWGSFDRSLIDAVATAERKILTARTGAGIEATWEQLNASFLNQLTSGAIRTGDLRKFAEKYNLDYASVKEILDGGGRTPIKQLRAPSARYEIMKTAGIKDFDLAKTLIDSGAAVEGRPIVDETGHLITARIWGRFNRNVGMKLADYFEQQGWVNFAQGIRDAYKHSDFVEIHVSGAKGSPALGEVRVGGEAQIFDLARKKMLYHSDTVGKAVLYGVELGGVKRESWTRNGKGYSINRAEVTVDQLRRMANNVGKAGDKKTAEHLRAMVVALEKSGRKSAMVIWQATNGTPHDVRFVDTVLANMSRKFENLSVVEEGNIQRGRVNDFYVRMDLDRDGSKELYRLSGRYTLDRGIMNFEGDVYRVTSDGSEVKINPRGGITKIEGLQVGGVTHGKTEAEDAFNVPTVKLSMFSVGADGRMSLEGVREILKTFSMATDESLDPETRKAAMARGEFYLHILENDPALRAAFVKSMTDLIHTYIRETHDVGIANKITVGIIGEAGVRSEDSVVGKIVNLISGWAASFKGLGRDELSKKAGESTTVNKFAGAIEGIISEANRVLSDEEQMRLLGHMYDNAIGKALNTVREQPGEYETDRSFGRIITGSIPGVDVGRTGERLVHAAKEMLSGAKDAANDLSTSAGKGMKDAFRDTAKGTQDLTSDVVEGAKNLLDFDIKR